MENPETKRGVFVIERRKEPRLNVELPLDYSSLSEGEVDHGTVSDATEGGILVHLPERFKIGDLLKIRIFISTESSLNTIEAIARIVWTDPADNKIAGMYRYGMQMHSFYKKDLHRFRALLKEVEKLRGPIQSGSDCSLPWNQI